MDRSEVGGYSGLQIALHWTIAALVLFQLIFGESMEAAVDAAEEGAAVSPTDATLASAHYWVGIAVLALVAVRIVLRLVQGAPAPVYSGWTAKAAAAVHGLFYLLLVLVPVTGLLAIYVSSEFGDIHTLAKPAFIVLIVLHAGAALFHQLFLRDGTLSRMLVPGR